MPARPDRNVLILIADDWSPLARCYGNEVVQTPRIDDAFARGCAFDNAFCTSPSCAVSRACILTGQHGHTHGQYGHCHGIHGFRTHEFMRPLPAVLGDAGAACGLIGKNHTLPHDVYRWDDRYRSGAASIREMNDRFQRLLTDEPGKPFLAMVAPSYPHRTPGDHPYGLHFRPDEFDDAHYDPADVIVPDFLPDTPEVRGDLAAYYQGVTRYDACVGRILETLDASGRADGTLVFIMTDHAMPFPGAKASSFDTGQRCPLIIRHPDQKNRGLHIDALVNWLDIAPTIYEWMGVDPPDEPIRLPGRSLLPILETAHPEGWDETTFSHNFHEVTNYYPYRVVRGRQYKYVRNLAHQLPTPLPSDLFRSPTWTAVREQGLTMMGKRPTDHFLHQPREALYDIVADPMETINLIDDPSLAATADGMRRRCIQMRIDTRDPWLMIEHQEGDPLVADSRVVVS